MDSTKIKALSTVANNAPSFLLFCWNILWKSVIISVAVVTLSYVYLTMQDSWGIALALFIVLLVFFGMREAWFDIADPPSSSRTLIHATAFLIFVATFFSVAYFCIYFLHYFGVLSRGF